MSKFKVGDRVRSVKNACAEFRRAAPSYRGFEGVVNSADGFHIGFEGGACCYANVRFELVQDNKDKEMEKRYEIETGLAIWEVESLMEFTCNALGFQDLHNTLFDIIQKAQRKVVKIGDKEYYEDELQTALSNIKPINSTGE